MRTETGWALSDNSWLSEASVQRRRGGGSTLQAAEARTAVATSCAARRQAVTTAEQTGWHCRELLSPSRTARHYLKLSGGSHKGCRMAQVPHFHSKEQLLSALHAGVASLNVEYAACTEPQELCIRVRQPDGNMAVVATVSVQPPQTRKKRRAPDGEPLGGYHGHLLFKRPETGAVTRLKNILEGDANLLAAVWAAHGTSRSGAAITHKSYLAESLADKAWATLSEEDKSPWHIAAETSKRHLTAVDWSELEGALDECEGFTRFLTTLTALGNPVRTHEHKETDHEASKKHGLLDLDD